MEATEYIDLYNNRNTDLNKNYESGWNSLFVALKANGLSAYTDNIKSAFDLCYNSHIGISIASGAPYWTHPLAVALILLEELHIDDADIIIAALLHNVLRDNIDLNFDILSIKFGKGVVELIHNLQKLSLSNYYYQNIDNNDWNLTNSFSRAFILLASDIRIFVLQLCNRLHDIRNLQYWPISNQKAIAKETLSFYIPLSYRFGFHKIQTELEELSFYYFNRTEYRHITDLIEQKNKHATDFIFIAVDTINNILHKNDILYNIKINHIPKYKLFLEMQKKTDVYEMENILSIKIILDTDNPEDSLKVFNLLKKYLLTNKLFDYSEHPISEVDGSISARIFNPVTSTIININTKQQHIHSKNYNFLKHKQTNSSFEEKDIVMWEQWINNIIKTKDTNQAENIIWQTITTNLYGQTLTVYDKKHNKYSLPEGSTAIDFAFNISKSIGLSAISCKINGSVKDMFYVLKQNDIVEIIASEKHLPDSNWLNHCVSINTISQLTEYFNEKYHTNFKPANKNTQYQSFRFIFSKYIPNITAKIKKIISNENIKRIRFATSGNNFIVRVDTNIKTDDLDAVKNTNNIFINIIKEAKSVSIINTQ